MINKDLIEISIEMGGLSEAERNYVIDELKKYPKDVVIQLIRLKKFVSHWTNELKKKGFSDLEIDKILKEYFKNPSKSVEEISKKYKP